MVTTERIRELRHRYSSHGSLASVAPQEVWRTNRDLIAIMDEVLEYREKADSLPGETTFQCGTGEMGTLFWSKETNAEVAHD